jgi:hypothetical protein
MLLVPIYEQDFHNGSFGFRPKRIAHQALAEVWEAAMGVNGGWVLEVDVCHFFDTIDHTHLREFVSRRVRDGVLRRLIGKWLKSGVMEGDELSFSESGTPQGGVISPLLANIYLHYVLDEWFEKQVKPVMRGKCRLIRYADDFVIVFQLKYDAERLMAVISKRFEKYGLSVAKQNFDEPCAVVSARTDLWELWGSNRPEPPDLPPLSICVICSGRNGKRSLVKSSILSSSREQQKDGWDAFFGFVRMLCRVLRSVFNAAFE